MILKKFRLPIIVFILTFILLAIVQIKLERPLILAERFLKGAGWIEIFLISGYGAFVINKMQDPLNVPRWRKISWTIFSVVFFSQLIIGISGFDKFLMTGKLHLPVPMMILAGPIYRQQLSVMTILFLSTIILSGPAWCSQICYFGAFDNLASGGKTSKDPLKYKGAIKTTLLLLVTASALILRWFSVSLTTATILAIAFGVTGILIILVFSAKRKKMIHCIMYCPIGTIVNILRHITPYRMIIDRSCTLCMQCTKFCKYDALNARDIKNSKPSVTCTLCGDCLAGCSHNAIKYRFLNLRPERARNLYLIITITLHAACIALARI